MDIDISFEDRVKESGDLYYLNKRTNQKHKVSTEELLKKSDDIIKNVSQKVSNYLRVKHAAEAKLWHDGDGYLLIWEGWKDTFKPDDVDKYIDTDPDEYGENESYSSTYLIEHWIAIRIRLDQMRTKKYTAEEVINIALNNRDAFYQLVDAIGNYIKERKPLALPYRLFIVDSLLGKNELFKPLSKRKTTFSYIKLLYKYCSCSSNLIAVLFSFFYKVFKCAMCCRKV